MCHNAVPHARSSKNESGSLAKERNSILNLTLLGFVCTCAPNNNIKYQVKVVWDRIFLHSSSPASQWAPIFLFLLELLRRASDALREESRFSELIQRLVNMPFRELCRGNGACSTIEEARRCDTEQDGMRRDWVVQRRWRQGREGVPYRREGSKVWYITVRDTNV